MTRKNLSVAFLLIPALILSACAGTPAAAVNSQAPSAIVQTTSTIARGVKAVANAAASQLMVVPTPTVPVAPVSSPKDAPAAQPQTGAVQDLTGFQSELEAVYQKVNPSVVSIDVLIGSTSSSSRGRTTPFGNSGGVTAALGSGFVWDTEGHIVTNNHVVSGATQITVTFASGESFDAKLVGSDPNADIAVIKISAPASLLVPVEVGDTTQVKVGQVAIAIGNPYGLSNTMTQGIISALSRSLPVESSSGNSANAAAGPTYSIPDIIQTDAAINPGNSGGVLVDISGKLIGITAAISSSTDSNSGIGFVIPSEIVSKVVPALVKTGVFQHPYLGITGTNLTAELAKAMNLDATQRGALVIDVTAGGPADKAGLKAGSQTVSINGNDIPVGGDVIVAVNGQKVSDFDDLSSYVFIHTNAGETIDLTVLRGGKEVSLKLTVGSMTK